MTSLHPILTSLNEEIKVLRRIQNTIESEKFKSLFQRLSEQEKNIVVELIRTRKERALKEHLAILGSRHKDYEAMTVESLRVIGGAQGIQYYSTLTKAELISEIQKNDSRGQNRSDSEGSQIGGLGRKPLGHKTQQLLQG